MRYDLIFNPAAGSGYAKDVIIRITSLLDSWHAEYKVHETVAPGNATEIARDLSFCSDNVIIAVGGDGTASEVAAGLAGTGAVMGIIPAGTGNDFVKTVKIPKDPETAMRFMLDRPPRAIDTGTINGQFFLNVCGTGFDVTVLECAEEKKKKHRGLTPYLLGLLKAIRVFEPVDLTIEYDGHTEQNSFLVCSVANGKIIGGGIPICPAADAADGKLDLVMIRAVPRWKIPLYLPGLMLSRDLRFRITKHMTAERITVRGNALKFNIDGEIRRLGDAEFIICPASLKLIC